MEHRSGFGERDTATVTHEQLNSELMFELSDRPRQRRLSDVQLVGGSSEVESLGDGKEVAQLTCLEILHSTTLIPGRYHHRRKG